MLAVFQVAVFSIMLLILVKVGKNKKKSHMSFLYSSIALLFCSATLVVTFIKSEGPIKDLYGGEKELIFNLGQDVIKYQKEISELYNINSRLNYADDKNWLEENEKTIDILKLEIARLNLEILNRSEYEDNYELYFLIVDVISLLISALGFGVATNYISKITSENEQDPKFYIVSKRAYQQVKEMEQHNRKLYYVIIAILLIQFFLCQLS